jgi:hypothetical protein
MNDDALRRLLRNSLLGRRTPADHRERLLARLTGAPRRPLALTLAAAAAILTAAALKLAFPRTPEAVPAPVKVPAAIAAAVEQHVGTSETITKAPPLAPRELIEQVREQSGFVVDLPGLRDAGYEAREVHRCLDKGFAHVIYANTWSKLSCFLFEEGRLSGLEAGEALADGAGRQFTVGDVSAVAVKDGSIVKVWISELRPGQLGAIALDAERKRDALQTTVLAGVKGADPRAVETLLQGIHGVEFVSMGASSRKVVIQYDGRQVSEEAIGAVASMNGLDWAAEGR